MSSQEDRKALVVELFNVTGEAVPENDPIVTGALFFSYKLGESGRLAEEAIRNAASHAMEGIREAGRLAAQDIREAGRQAAQDSAGALQAADAATRSATAAIDKMSADRLQLMKAVEAQMVKCLKQAGKEQSGVQAFHHIPTRYAVLGSIIGAVVLAAALTVGIQRGSDVAAEAAVGRSFARAVSTMDTKLREQVLEHLRKIPD